MTQEDAMKMTKQGAIPKAGYERGAAVTTKESLLLMMSNADQSVAIERVLNSGLLSSGLRKRWADTFIKRGINEVLGKSGCPAWEGWAVLYLSDNDGTMASADSAAEFARAAMSISAHAINAKRHAMSCAVLLITEAARAVARNTRGAVIIAFESAVKAASMRSFSAQAAGPTKLLARAFAWFTRTPAVLSGGSSSETTAEADEVKMQYDELLTIIKEMQS
jgi:hypothetical protein